MNTELFQEVLSWLCSSFPEDTSAEDYARRAGRVMMDACDVAARRIGPRPRRASTYWWNDAIVEARRLCVARRRAWTRARRGPPTLAAVKQRQYKLARNALRMEIKRAKARAWGELIASIDEDPWGFPYRLVMGRLRGETPGLTASLRPAVLRELLSSLFPSGVAHDPGELWTGYRWDDCWSISIDEVTSAIGGARSRGGDPAPGPDGLRLSVWRRVPRNVVLLLMKTFNACLRDGIFPSRWKRALLVLIPKGERVSDPTVVPKSRPICLLNEIGKFLERILVRRILAWMDAFEESRLSENQFGFRQGRSTCDALRLVRNIIDVAINRRKFVIAVSLDIKNAFNSVPWSAIRLALLRRGFPEYLRRIIDSYLHDRLIIYPVASGDYESRPMLAGVPQDSVLGPLLWNITFDAVPRSVCVAGCRIVCYADDTLILAVADDPHSAAMRASDQISAVLRRIRELGLAVAAEKTEVVLFRGSRIRPPINVSVRVGECSISPSLAMKYLGIYLDSRLTFEEHFARTEVKLSGVVGALCRLMPNLRGSGERKRRLYANVVSSIALYGAPIWAQGRML